MQLLVSSQRCMCARAAMEKAVNSFEEDHEEDDTALLDLWPEAAVHMLLFTLSKDPSVRIRRAAMAVLTAIPSRQHSAQEAAILQLLLLKCRDKDTAVQQQALSRMSQLPADTLSEHLSIEDWRAVLDTALLGAYFGTSSGTDAQGETQAFGSVLLHKWLRTSQLGGISSDAEAMCRSNDRSVATFGATLEQAAYYLRALQIPWQIQPVYQAYSAALSKSV